MSATEPLLSDRATELRRAFDRSFMKPESTESSGADDYLSIHVGGDPYAMRLPQVAGLYCDTKVTPLPSAVPELRGLAGFRGAILPVYDLAALLLYPIATSPRWLAAAAEAKVAFAFDEFDGHFRLMRSAAPGHVDPEAHEYVREIVRVNGVIRRIVNLPSIVAAIRKRSSGAGTTKEP
jgi:purine-binding chemotaxis protein CheW